MVIVQDWYPMCSTCVVNTDSQRFEPPVWFEKERKTILRENLNEGLQKILDFFF